MKIRQHNTSGKLHLFRTDPDDNFDALCGRASLDTTEPKSGVRWEEAMNACLRCDAVFESHRLEALHAASTSVENTGSPNGDLPLSDVPILELDEVTLTILTWRGHGAGLIEELLPTIAQQEGYQVLASIDTSITEREGTVSLA